MRNLLQYFATFTSGRARKASRPMQYKGIWTVLELPLSTKEPCKASTQVFLSSLGFQSIFSICHSLVLHLISSQFPPPFCHLIMWTSVASYSLMANMGSLLNPNCYTQGKCLQVNLLTGSHL